MELLVVFLGVIVACFGLKRWILPRLGVKT